MRMPSCRYCSSIKRVWSVVFEIRKEMRTFRIIGTILGAQRKPGCWKHHLRSWNCFRWRTSLNGTLQPRTYARACPQLARTSRLTRCAAGRVSGCNFFVLLAVLAQRRSMIMCLPSSDGLESLTECRRALAQAG